MSKMKFAAIFGGGLLAGMLGAMAVQTAIGRSGTYGGEILLLPMVLLLLYAGYCLGRSRDGLHRMVQQAKGEVTVDGSESAEYWNGYDEGYTDALETMEFSKPVRNRPEKKRRRKDRKSVPERRKGA